MRNTYVKIHGGSAHPTMGGCLACRRLAVIKFPIIKQIVYKDRARSVAWFGARATHTCCSRVRTVNTSLPVLVLVCCIAVPPTFERERRICLRFVVLCAKWMRSRLRFFFCVLSLRLRMRIQFVTRLPYTVYTRTRHPFCTMRCRVGTRALVLHTNISARYAGGCISAQRLINARTRPLVWLSIDGMCLWPDFVSE